MDFYEEIAGEVKLASFTKRRFARFMRKRFERLVTPGYAKEWALRFKAGAEYLFADTESEKALLEIDKKEKDSCAGFPISGKQLL